MRDDDLYCCPCRLITGRQDARSRHSQIVAVHSGSRPVRTGRNRMHRRDKWVDRMPVRMRTWS
jgi:hypothetical protein